jgi:23S rRNA pseudouridine1911/1915/1917 synthase
MRLDLALIARHPELSRRQARAAIERGQVTVDGATVCEPGRRLEPKAEIAWHRQRKALPRRIRDPFVLYHDEHVIVIDKPAGLLSVPTPGADRGGEDTAQARVGALLKRGSGRRPYVGRVHRLDRDTSGALAFALSREARSGLIEAFRRHDIERVYLALASGPPRAASGTIDAPIRDVYSRGRRGVARSGEPGSPSRTHWRVVELLGGAAALLEARPETGRQHQIRAHLAHAGLPLLGDRVYSAPSSAPPPAPPSVSAPRTMLHAWRLAFNHPLSGLRVATESPLPPDFASLLERLRARSSARAPRRGRAAEMPRRTQIIRSKNASTSSRSARK